MRILILTDINSAHSQKWIVALSKKGVSIGIYTLSRSTSDWYKILSNVTLLYSANEQSTKFSAGILSKLSYLKALPALKKVITAYRPDIVHAHYATSYGLLARLSRFKPYMISAWGSDVMSFPNKSFIHKGILRKNLEGAAMVMATSETISQAIKKVINCDVKIIPFGIDLTVFKKLEVKSVIAPGNVVVGTIKSMEEVYGIDVLIKAFAVLKNDKKIPSIKLLIVGTGTLANTYKTLVRDLKIENDVVFTGKIGYENVVNYHNMIDIFVNVSRNESFGVSVIESSACEKPVIVSNVGGLPFVVRDKYTGLVVEVENYEETANAIEQLIKNVELRISMGKAGRAFVASIFELNKNTDELLRIYNQTLELKS
jgi:glycosyltransferase involved in cell wall biosynthesis